MWTAMVSTIGDHTKELILRQKIHAIANCTSTIRLDTKASAGTSNEENGWLKSSFPGKQLGWADTQLKSLPTPPTAKRQRCISVNLQTLAIALITKTPKP